VLEVAANKAEARQRAAGLREKYARLLGRVRRGCFAPPRPQSPLRAASLAANAQRLRPPRSVTACCCGGRRRRRCHRPGSAGGRGGAAWQPAAAGRTGSLLGRLAERGRAGAGQEGAAAPEEEAPAAAAGGTEAAASEAAAADGREREEEIVQARRARAAAGWRICTGAEQGLTVSAGWQGASAHALQAASALAAGAGDTRDWAGRWVGCHIGPRARRCAAAPVTSRRASMAGGPVCSQQRASKLGRSLSAMPLGYTLP